MNDLFRTGVLTAAIVLGARDFLSSPSLWGREFRSSSGRVELRVAPSGSETRKQAECRLFKDGKAVWQKTFPFPLLYARVLDDGTVAGFGYTHGVEGVGGETLDEPGDLVISLIDPGGNVRLKEAYHRRFVESTCTAALPVPGGGEIVMDPGNDLVIFLMRYGFSRDDDTAWRQFQLSTGKPLGVFYPQEQTREPECLCPCPRVRPLPGTSLVLVQWGHLEQRGQLSLENAPVYGAHFALLDRKCNPVWQITLPGDYEVPQDNEREERLVDWILANSAVLSVKAPGQFDLYFAKKGQRVSFAANQDERGRWAVIETGRKRHTPADFTTELRDR